MKRIVILAAMILLTQASFSQTPSKTIGKTPVKMNTSATLKVKDIDGNQYNVLKIGNRAWLKENLNVSRFRNGDPIREVKSYQEWRTASENKEPVWCYYNFNAESGKIYGKFYSVYAINDKRKIAPLGWHLPSEDEWVELDNSLGGSIKSGNKLRTDKVSEWITMQQPDAVSGFEAMSTGYVFDVGGDLFKNYGRNAGWWSSQKKDAYSQSVHFVNEKGAKMSNLANGGGLPIRCVLGEEVDPGKTVKFKSSATWMNSNLDVKVFNNGDPIPEAKTAQEWINAAKAGKPAWCRAPVIKGDSAYGILYNGYAIMDPRGLAPAGWRIPGTSDWQLLHTENYLLVSDSLLAVEMLKEEPGKHWDLQKTNDFYSKHPFSNLFENSLNLTNVGKDAKERGYNYYSNLSRFSVLPCGKRLENGTFGEQGQSCYYWSYDELDTGSDSNFIIISILDPAAAKGKPNTKNPAFILDRTKRGQGFSVRCVKKSTFVIAKP